MNEYADADDPEDPDDADVLDDQSSEKTLCPYCGESIYEAAEICPHCRSYISIEDAPRRRLPRWIWIAVVAGLATALTWVGFRF